VVPASLLKASDWREEERTDDTIDVRTRRPREEQLASTCARGSKGRKARSRCTSSGAGPRTSPIFFNSHQGVRAEPAAPRPVPSSHDMARSIGALRAPPPSRRPRRSSLCETRSDPGPVSSWTAAAGSWCADDYGRLRRGADAPRRMSLALVDQLVALTRSTRALGWRRSASPWLRAAANRGCSAAGGGPDCRRNDTGGSASAVPRRLDSFTTTTSWTTSCWRATTPAGGASSDWDM